MAMKSSKITSADRLSLTLFLAAVVHALVILGIGFSSPPAKPPYTPPMIEVTLAERPADETPPDYDFLAQVDQDGGGKSEEKQRPKEASPASPTADAGAAATQTTPAAAPEQNAPNPEVITRHEPNSGKPAEPAPLTEMRPPTAADLISDRQQLAQAVARQQESDDVFSRYPSKRRIDARTKAHAAAEYMRQWVSKVEQVGNLNYPEEARRRRLSGSLVLEVTLRPNGSLVGVRILDSSRHPVLDQAAMRIVHIAAPFAAVPSDVLAGNDLLVITRTWEFLDQAGLSTHN